jgi:hypothetical protein
MLRWLLEEWFARLLSVSILPRDARHRYVSRAGTAYAVDVAPVPGVLAAVEVTLRGEPAIRGTALPGLTVIVKPTALRVGAAIRYLLHQADFESGRMLALGEEFSVTTVQPEPDLSEAQTQRLVELLEAKVVERLTTPSAEEMVDDER